MMGFSSVIEEALRAAGAAVKKGGGRVVGIGAYGDVTYDLDKLAEEAITKVIIKNWPDATIITEEAGITGSGSPYVLVDPLDGSTNAVRQVPFYCSAMSVSKSPLFIDLVASGVMDILRDELFLATRSQGCFINGSKAQCSSTTTVREAVICLDIQTVPKPIFPREALVRLFNKTKYPRSLGSAALEVAYICSGRVDAFLEGRIHLRTFDCLPSIFLVKEAGGYVKCFNEDLNRVDLRSKQRLAFLVAGNRDLGDEITSFLKGAR